MPVQWTVSHPTRLVVAVARGDLRLTDIEGYLDEVVTGGVLGYRKIFDMTHALPVFEDGALMALGARIRAYRTLGKMGPLAIVATTAESFDHAQIFAVLAEADRPIRIFRDPHEARHWLDGLADSAPAKPD